METILRLVGKKNGSRGQSLQKLVCPNLVQHGLIEALAAESLGRKEVCRKPLKNFGVVFLVLLKEGVLFYGFDQLFRAGIQTGKIGRLDFKQADPRLKIKKLALFRGRNPSCLKGDFQKCLALGCGEFIQGEATTSDFPHGLGGRIDIPFGGPVSKENERDADYGKQHEEESFEFVMEEGDHVSFWLVRGGGGKRKIMRMRQTWSWFFLLWACFLDLGICQDQIRLKSGEVIQGTAVKFDENSMTLTFRFSKGTLGYSQTDLAEVNLAERPGVAEGRKALSAGQWDQVVDKWKTAVDELMGVDSPWVLECAGGLGQAYLAQGRVADAESLYVKMKRFYPNGSAALRADVGLAEATAGKDTDGLLKKLQLLEGQFQEGLRPVRADREALAEYYFARGKAYEKKEEWKKALEDYLRVSALYPEPPSLGQRAEQRAQALRQSRKDLVTD